jgi:hypothetical protein
VVARTMLVLISKPRSKRARILGPLCWHTHHPSRAKASHVHRSARNLAPMACFLLDGRGAAEVQGSVTSDEGKVIRALPGMNPVWYSTVLVLVKYSHRLPTGTGWVVTVPYSTYCAQQRCSRSLVSSEVAS